MKKYIYILVFIFSVVSCKRDPVPKDALKRDVFIDVLVDMHIAESLYRERRIINMDSLNSSKLYNSVLKKHGVTNDEVLLTSLYYSRHQREYDKIYAEVLDRINLKIEEVNQSEEEEDELNPVEKTDDAIFKKE